MAIQCVCEYIYIFYINILVCESSIEQPRKQNCKKKNKNKKKSLGIYIKNIPINIHLLIYINNIIHLKHDNLYGLLPSIR